MHFSVLLSLYDREKPQFLDECLKSLTAQTLKADEIILVEDGPLPQELRAVIERYAALLPLKTISLSRSCGLAAALNEGLKHCRHELVARMDTDDVSLPDRFRQQVRFMVDNPCIDVCSTWIEERETMDQPGFLKRLPTQHEAILRFAKRRNPIAHPSVMYRRDSVGAVGGYPRIFPEDYALWALMLVKGYRFSNVPEVLLYMRTGTDFISRRGWNFLKGEAKMLRYQRAIGFLTSLEYCANLLMRSIVRLPPPFFRKLFYKYSR